jgi:CRP/FNR family cyclic AMP-dependent transcriptional regulator
MQTKSDPIASTLDGLCFAMGLPNEALAEFAAYRTVVNYTPGALIFSRGDPADILRWVTKGIVKVICPVGDGSQIFAQLVTANEFLGSTDQLNDRNQWVHRFEARAMTKCEIAMVTRHHLSSLLRKVDPKTLVEMIQHLNSMWAGWVEHCTKFLGLSFPKRLKLVLTEMGRKFGVPDQDGLLLTFELNHADIAEMIGSSRPLVSRLMAELEKAGEIAKRGRRYVILKSGSIGVSPICEDEPFPMPNRTRKPSAMEDAARSNGLNIDKVFVSANSTTIAARNSRNVLA